MSIRTRWQSSATRTRVSNAWYRSAGRRIHGTRQEYRNWLSGRARARGKAPLPDRITRGVGSRLPVVRDRINPATGRPRWTDRSDGALAKWRADRERTGNRDPGPRQTRSRAPRGVSRREGSRRIGLEDRAAEARGRGDDARAARLGGQAADIAARQRAEYRRNTPMNPRWRTR